MKPVALALAVVALCSVSLTQTSSQKPLVPQRPVGIDEMSAPATASCEFNFSSGSGNTYLYYCVSVNGNVFYINTPVGYAQNSVYEGYGFCDANQPAAYYDYGFQGDSGNWNAPTLVGSNATTVKISRTTSDGLWTLTQTITQVASNATVKIVMTLRNNTAVARTAYLIRYNYVSPDGFVFANYDGTQDSAFAWRSAPNPAQLIPSHGLALQNVGNPAFPQWGGVPQNTALGPNPCAFAYNWTGGLASNINGSLVMAYVGTVPAMTGKTVTMTYKGL